ncbi:integrase [Oxalobacteraceae bacterium GrIS 1.18]
MSLFKRSTSPAWYFKLYPPGGGKPIQGSTGTTDKGKAQEFHDRLKADLWDQAKLGHKPRYTWNDAVIRFVSDREHSASLETVKIHLRWLDPYLDNLELSKIDRAMIDKIATAKRAEFVMTKTKDGPISTGRKVKPSTVNRVLEVLSSVLNAAVEWEWLDRMPKVAMQTEPSKRIRWITQDQAKLLLTALPSHLSDLALFSLETGLRRANATGLQYSQVDLKRRMAWIHPDQAKARKAIPVPLSDVAMEVLRRQCFAKRKPEFTDSVFVFRGQPVHQTGTRAWKEALAKVGISDFRWHDLRHTWASWHVQRGTPLHVLKELGGWETMEMVQRYAHLSADHLAQWVQSVSNDSCNLAAVEELKKKG